MRSSMSPEQEDLELFKTQDGAADRSVTLGSGFMPDLFSSLEYNIRMGSGLATVQSAKEPIVERIVENGMIKVKRKILNLKMSKWKQAPLPQPHQYLQPLQSPLVQQPLSPQWCQIQPQP